MVKYTKYDYGYPTIWSKWMYPPKNISTLQYIKAACQGWYTAKKSTIVHNKFLFFAFAGTLYFTYKLSFDWSGLLFVISFFNNISNIYSIKT